MQGVSWRVAYGDRARHPFEKILSLEIRYWCGDSMEKLIGLVVFFSIGTLMF